MRCLAERSPALSVLSHLSLVDLYNMDCRDAMSLFLPDNSVDAIVCDPPYGLAFMGKKWDYDVPGVDIWAECLRVLKPGGHLLAFAGTRTQHRMAVRIEDAGFEIRDMIAWVYGSGFPKSLDVSKAIDKAAGAERPVVGSGVGRTGLAAQPNGGSTFSDDAYQWPGRFDITAPATDAARQWEGWGTALKPALETVTFASKPYTDEQVRDIIQSNLFRLEARLWLLSSANAAGKSSTSNQSEYGAACAIAQWNADEITSTRADLCGQMGTSLFALATTTSLNIVSSWRRTLDESWSDGSTSTIETKSSTTIDWRTLKFSVSQITPASIIKACSLPGGFSANASTAESHFNASLLLLQSILTLSVTEPVISLAQHEHQGAGVTPNLDPVVLARKPLVGTVAANVLEHGTGVLNIDGCRVPVDPETDASQLRTMNRSQRVGDGGWGMSTVSGDAPQVVRPDGRWPANLIHDGSDEVLAVFPQAKGQQGAPRGDTGSAARFFMQCKGDYNDAWQDLNLPQENANTAEQSSSQQRQAAVSALVLAVSSALPEGLLCSGLSMAPFTSATANELRLIAETATQTIQTIGSKFWRESKPARLSLSLNHASDAEIQRLTDTTTITVSRWKSDGSAEPVTFSITPMSLEVGGKDCAPSMDGKRFMYCAKASKRDRDEGLPLSVVVPRQGARPGSPDETGKFPDHDHRERTGNFHPTVKPTDLMAYLCRLVTPPGGVVFDPFMGSGSTGKAALREGFGFIGCEMDAEYFAIAQARIAAMKDAA